MTRREFAIKRLLPIAMFTAIALIAHDTCNKADRTHATVTLDFGAAVDRVRAVEAEVFVDDERVGSFSRRAQPGMKLGPCTFKVALPAPDAAVKIVVELDSGEPRMLERRIHAEEGSRVTLSLGADL